jgi:hypothetical protein
MNSFPHAKTNGQTTEQALAEAVVRIYQRAQTETLALIQSRPAEMAGASARDWMSAMQLAEYWQLYNDKNEPTTAGILKWSKRRPDQFPLPHAYMGDLLRFNRSGVDLWKGRSRKAKNSKRKAPLKTRVTHQQTTTKIVATLTAACSLKKGRSS